MSQVSVVFFQWTWFCTRGIEEESRSEQVRLRRVQLCETLFCEAF